ncbi:MAG: Efflux ABC transporter, permease protein, partial [uncultured Solirubrobacteraceae bacterium]
EHARRRDPRRAGLGDAPAAPERGVGVPHLRLARDAQDQARPGAADRRDDHARALPADVHVPVRRRAGRLDGGVPAVPPARHARAVRPVHRRVLRRDAQHGRHEGRRRSLPHAAGVAPGPAHRRRPRRLRPLRDRRHRRDGPGADHGLPARGGRRRGARGDRPRRRLLVRARLGVHDGRHADARAQRRDEHRLHGALPADLPEQHLRRSADAAGMARGLRRRQPDLAPDDRGARAHGRDGERRRRRARARRGRRADRGLRSSDRPPLPRQGV